MFLRHGLPGWRGAAVRYRALRQVVNDDVGAVWQAQDRSLAHPVTIRSVVDAWADDDRFLARFQRDIRMVRRLAHPSVATYFIVHVGQRGRWGAFAVMEPLLETLRHRIHREGPFTANQAAPIAADLADGLQAVHEAGVVHGRLSADAVMFTPDGSAKLFDFGISAAGERGDPGAVEVNDGEVIIGMSAAETTPRAATAAGDVHSLGAVLFEMLTGDAPIPQMSARQMRSALEGIGEEVADACLSALSPDARSRPSAAELSSALSQDCPSPLSAEAVREIRTNFGIVLREWRTRAGFTQAKLAGMGGLNASFVSQLERGVKAPSLLAVCALADALGASPSEMLEAVERRRGSHAGRDADLLDTHVAPRASTASARES